MTVRPQHDPTEMVGDLELTRDFGRQRVARASTRAVRVQPKQRRAASTIDALVEATIRALAEFGEAGFRVEEVLAETGTSKGSLYHHFTNRDGLIEAATLVEFSRQIATDTAAIRQALDGAETRDDLLARLDAINAASQHPDRAAGRAKRLRILGTAVNRPALWTALGQEQSKLTDSITRVIETGQRRGLVPTSIDARALGTFIQSYTLGRVIGDIDPSPVDPAAWTALIRRVIHDLVLSPA